MAGDLSRHLDGQPQVVPAVPGPMAGARPTVIDRGLRGLDSLAMHGALRHESPAVAPVERLIRDHDIPAATSVARMLRRSVDERERRIGRCLAEIVSADREANQLGVHLTDRLIAAIEAIEAERSRCDEG